MLDNLPLPGAASGGGRDDGPLGRLLGQLGRGWVLLAGGRIGGKGGPRIDIVALHPRHGIALLEIPPHWTPDAEILLLHRLDRIGLREAFGGFPPIVHLSLPRDGLAALPQRLAEGFAAQPPLILVGGTAWVQAARRALSEEAAAPRARPAAARPAPRGAEVTAPPRVAPAPPPAAPEPGGRAAGRRQGHWLTAVAVLTGVAALLVALQEDVLPRQAPGEVAVLAVPPGGPLGLAERPPGAVAPQPSSAPAASPGVPDQAPWPAATVASPSSLPLAAEPRVTVPVAIEAPPRPGAGGGPGLPPVPDDATAWPMARRPESPATTPEAPLPDDQPPATPAARLPDALAAGAAPRAPTAPPLVTAPDAAAAAVAALASEGSDATIPAQVSDAREAVPAPSPPDAAGIIAPGPWPAAAQEPVPRAEPRAPASAADPPRDLAGLAEPAFSPPPERPAAKPAQPPPALRRQAPPATAEDPALLAALLRRGHEMLVLGDISAARRFFERAAAAGSADAALAAGDTYGPAALATLQVAGLAPDAEAAAAWYRQAAALGAEAAAAARLAALSDHERR